MGPLTSRIAAILALLLFVAPSCKDDADDDSAQPAGDDDSAAGDDDAADDDSAAGDDDTTETCEDECDPQGDRICEDPEDYRVCGYHDGDSCLEWSDPIPCGVDHECLGGECTQTDLDGDGLGDLFEEQAMAEYLPFLSMDPGDGCPRSILVYRLRPHPADAMLLHILVDRLFENDCGLNGHPGDNEAFGMTVDPTLPGAAGILAVRAISHQDTICEHVTDCGQCAGMDACTQAIDGRPAVFYSNGKHGSYIDEGACDWAFICGDACVLADVSSEPPAINAGEPDAPLVNDLTAAGMITAAAGWTEQDLFDYDPWGGDEFGNAGIVSDDLVDDAFLTDACTP